VYTRKFFEKMREWCMSYSFLFILISSRSGNAIRPRIVSCHYPFVFDVSAGSPGELDENWLDLPARSSLNATDSRFDELYGHATSYRLVDGHNKRQHTFTWWCIRTYLRYPPIMGADALLPQVGHDSFNNMSVVRERTAAAIPRRV
jgi:hypothetical protein